MPNSDSRLDPSRTALLVMDYQRGVLDRLPESDTPLDAAARAIEMVRRAGGLIAYVRVAFDDADFDAIPETSRMGQRVAAAGRSFHIDSPATRIHDRIAPEPGDLVVRKTRVGAFSTTDLDAQLRDRGVDTLILAGVATSGVVLSTVRDASDRDYVLFVLADATADSEADVHNFLVTRILPRQAEVITTDDLEVMLGPKMI
jgi:nicotinamidase-related amidase